MSDRILIVVGTPIADSLNHALARSYADAARSAGADVRVIDLAVVDAPSHPQSRDEVRMPRSVADAPLDPVAAAAIEDVGWAEHLVFFFPQWWGTYPGALKVFIDRVFLSGFAFRYRPSGRLWDKLLTGRTARIVMTMDSPRAWNRLVYRGAAETSLRRAVLGYCGIRTVGVTRFAEVRHRDAATRSAWIARVAALGARDARNARRAPARTGAATRHPSHGRL
ncbi:NAD(P)H-dependent oxidoreductase [Microbacterium sp. NPDC089189]|uniref:NAD(P)H-dependent oxidoreductase n=1 Tax=Microbacterium sp. NPDC089189 TaxID=3154972 RepID=UPI00342E2D71